MKSKILFLFSLSYLLLLSSCGIYSLADGAGCFVQGTKILTPQGSAAIETFLPGQEVLSWDSDANQVVVGIVELLIVHENSTPGTLTLASGLQMGVTPDHPVFSVTREKWLPVSELNSNEKLKFYNAVSNVIEESSLAQFQQNLPVQTTYNLKVRRYENSFAEGMLAHFY
jgi:hypothetical protein